ncbi:hypothetical protein MTR_3g074420 [Medicago truncatula]|uniref:Uncharacterized protein n=1 Tax=Medicago truncatula TaxID=3880 RepID=A0A072UZS9_MEDTR|nr:hypothetical protein MTR_3g074420 [Medicago truncatula]
MWAQKHPKAQIKHNNKKPENIAPLYIHAPSPLHSSPSSSHPSVNLYLVAVHYKYVLSSSSHNHRCHVSSSDRSKAAVKRSNVVGENHIPKEKQQHRSRVKLKSATTQIQQQEKEDRYCH